MPTVVRGDAEPVPVLLNLPVSLLTLLHLSLHLYSHLNILPPAGAPVLFGACGTPIGMGVSFPGPTWEKGRTRPIAVSCTADLGGNWVVELGVKLGS